jgi:zinc D-Ala-D-Ala carboxypeptidase
MNPKYFTYLELVRTDTGLPNGPTDWQQVVNLQRLAFFLDRLREYMGSAVIVTSGFRSPEVNARVGGSKTSAHLQGLAADIVPKSRTQEDFKRMLAYLAPLAELKSVDQIIVYRNGDTVKWIHVGLKEDSLKNRGQVIYK